jgi:type II secretory ATPase GspE/PulE/Tfp pilus assembly ATPase PilB-like protein
MLLGIMPLDELNIYGIEDPPEIYQPRITQTAIKPDQDWTVEEALVEILRQQPHFAFVGEILDPRLAQLFMAANRKSVPIGSTIHAEDALVIVPALRNLDVPSSVIASGMTALASQRLVQHLCTRCRVAVKASTTLVGHLDRMGISDAAEFRVYERGRGCDWCTNGVVGRSAIFEIVTVTPEMREAIIAGDDRALVVAARKNGYVTMLEHALPRIVRGEIAQSALRDFPNSPAHSLALPLNNVTYLPRLLDAARGVLREAKSA